MQTNKINISLTGYTRVDFCEAPARSLSGNGSAAQNTITVPVDIAAVKNGAFIWLGAYAFSYGDVIDYDVSAGTGNGMATGLALPKDNPLNRVYFTIDDRQ